MGGVVQIGAVKVRPCWVETAEEVACCLGGGAIEADGVEIMVVVGKVVRVRVDNKNKMHDITSSVSII